MRIQIHTENSSRLEKELRQFQPLTSEENLDLLRQYKETNDDRLRQTIFNGNTRLIWLAANQYIGLFNYDKSELFSVGSIGLLKAIDNYNPDAGYLFSPYAKMCIINTFNNEVKANGSQIRIKSKSVKEISEEKLFNFISTSEPINQDGDVVEDLLAGDAGTFDEEIDAISTSDKINLFWETIKDCQLRPAHYDICKAIWSATTQTGKPIKVTSTEIAEMLQCSKQNIQFKKKSIIKRLKENKQLYEWYKNNYMDYE